MSAEISIFADKLKILEQYKVAGKSTYRCTQCGYSCDHYKGRGFFGQKISMVVCMHCHTIQPLTVGGMIADVAPSFSSEYGRLCPQCMSDDIKLWDENTCPKCGGRMLDEGDEEFWT